MLFNDIEKYNKEAKEKWGNTKEYKEFENRSKNYTNENKNNLINGMEQIMKDFARCMQEGNASDSCGAQNLVKTLQEYITNNFYTCTNDILKGLGIMYVTDKRFKQNIDKYASGTASFINDAINEYCK